MTGPRRKGPRQPRNHRPERRPPLTHFLCLPLINSTSLPQLESSIAAFKAAHPPVPVAELPNGNDRDRPAFEQDASRPLSPEGSFRPLGTLHLTLGVMSLPTQDRLEEAITFFHSLDLAALMREADRVAVQIRQRRRTQDAVVESRKSAGQPFNVSLESLHALPRAKAATVLHASPVDPTGRLYPFCVMLRDKFLEAGFMQSETREKKPIEKNRTQNVQAPSTPTTQNEAQPAQTTSACEDLEMDDKPLLDEPPSALAEEAASEQVSNPPTAPGNAPPILLDPYKAALARKPKPRPLLLHATLVNTIYVKGRPRAPPGGNSNSNNKNSRNRPGRLEFDARGLTAQYRDYYTDETRMIPRPLVVPQPPSQPGGQEASTQITTGDNVSSSSSSSAVEEETGHKRKKLATESPPRFPFVWAKEIPIDSVCICEMGAKKLDIDAENPGLNGRLGEMYTIVAERSLESGEGSSTMRARSLSPESEDGGMKLE